MSWREGMRLTDIFSDYIQIRQPVYISHSAGRYAAKRFRKAQCPIIERLTNSLMMNGRNNGKKLMAIRIVAHSFEIVRSTTPSTDRTTLLMYLDPHHDRPKPYPNRRRRHRQLRPSRRQHPNRQRRYRPSSSRRCFTAPPSQPGYRPTDHWCA
jgi:hypothetical protein